MERKYLTEWKRFLTENNGNEIRISSSTIQNPKMQGTSVEFTAGDMDPGTFKYIEPVMGYEPNLTIRVNNLDKQSDGSYAIKSKDDIELPRYADQMRYDSDEQQEMQNDMSEIKHRLYVKFSL